MSAGAGALRTLMALETRDAAPDGGGGGAGGWRRIGRLWAGLRPVSAWEREAGGGLLSGVSHRAAVVAVPSGSPDRPMPGMRLVERERSFAIRAVTEADPRGRRLLCWLEEVPAP